MALKVIGAGYGRTGTTSLKEALEQLGYVKCYHMTEVLDNNLARPWLEKLQGRAVDWDEVFAGYQAALDWPMVDYWRELVEFYPEAKVILTTRDPDSWYRSVKQTIYTLAHLMPPWLDRLPGQSGSIELIRTQPWHNIFQGRFEDPEYVKQVYREHIEEVKRTIPPERLLEFDVKDGWEPLCRFLEKPVPENTPFPRTNDTKEMQRRILLIRTLRLLPWSVGAAVILYLLFLLS